MCGRYTLTAPGDLLIELGLPATEIEPLYNVAPTEEAPVVRARRDGGRELAFLRWGLVPHWAKDPSAGGARMINARGESAPEKPAFRDPFKWRRCGVLADGFFEWEKRADGRQPFHITLAGRRPFLMAGLWERWRGGGGEPLQTFSILTCEPTPAIARLHDRMPVILGRDAWDLWLDREVEDVELLRTVLRPYDREPFEQTAVSRVVNKPQSKGGDCLAPVEPGGQPAP